MTDTFLIELNPDLHAPATMYDPHDLREAYMCGWRDSHVSNRIDTYVGDKYPIGTCARVHPLSDYTVEVTVPDEKGDGECECWENG